jgi:LmbE family N-acetylglucosaminyl deacetylase
MKPAKPLALTLVCVMAFAHAQSRTGTTAPSAATFTDPANLGDERVKPVTGRELPIDQGTAGVEEMLRRLNTRASLMLIVAHPDDEDGGMLTLYARGMGARVADLSLTRGEGGQNAMTGDFEDALGLLRTQELLSADRYSGVDQFFGTEVDFGFSKTKEEAFRKWGHERVLYDVVRAIRIYRPLVLASTWIGDVTDGHGQHQVSGEITQEAFKAAGDPNVFPELTKEGILPWQPMKVYARVPMQAITDKGLFDYATNQYVPASFTNYVTGAVSSTPPTVDVTIHEGTPDPLLTPGAANPEDLSPMLAKEAPSTPLTYVQFARIGLGLQKSQIGPGVRNPPAGSMRRASSTGSTPAWKASRGSRRMRQGRSAKEWHGSARSSRVRSPASPQRTRLGLLQRWPRRRTRRPTSSSWRMDLTGSARKSVPTWCMS